MFKTNQMRERRIRRIADALKAAKDGETITHEEIKKIARMDVVPNETIQKAHRLANEECGCFFDSVRGVGYIRRPATEWDAVDLRYRKRSRKQASTGRKFVTNIVRNTNELSDEEQRRASRAIGLMQTIEALTRRPAKK
jgi:hypothetical protein